MINYIIFDLIHEKVPIKRCPYAKALHNFTSNYSLFFIHLFMYRLTRSTLCNRVKQN